MKNNALASLWSHNVFKVLITISLFTAVSIPFWLGTSEGSVSKMLFFWLLAGLWMLAFLYFIDELKKVNDAIWRPMTALVIVICVFLIRLYPGLSTSEDGTLSFSLFHTPIIWMIVGTVIAYLIVRIYNRHNLQAMK